MSSGDNQMDPAVGPGGDARKDTAHSESSIDPAARSALPLLAHNETLTAPAGAIAHSRVFRIVESKPAYEPKVQPVPQFKLDKEFQCSDILDFEGRSDVFRVFISEWAKHSLQSHVCWGESLPANRVEQGGILLGHAYVDSATGSRYAVVTRVVAGRDTDGSAAYIQFTPTTWQQMLEEAERHGADLQVVGWYHTHPNNLSVFMSGTDRSTQARLFKETWHCAIVLNPHTQVWKAFAGPACEPCFGSAVVETPRVPADRKRRLWPFAWPR